MFKKMYFFLIVTLSVSLIIIPGCGSDLKAEILKDISAVWRGDEGLLWAFDLTTSKAMFEMSMGEQKQSTPISIVSVDTEKQIVVLKFVRPDKQEKILTLKKVYNDEKKQEFQLLLTRDDGVQSTLTYIRSITPGSITGS
ncbi:MAG: hypothetical protein Kow0029_30860 [Candidatus Rifleibacteriota bacterium]|jgi:hypothetical protein